MKTIRTFFNQVMENKEILKAAAESEKGAEVLGGLDSGEKATDFDAQIGFKLADSMQKLLNVNMETGKVSGGRLKFIPSSRFFDLDKKGLPEGTLQAAQHGSAALMGTMIGEVLIRENMVKPKKGEKLAENEIIGYLRRRFAADEALKSFPTYAAYTQCAELNFFTSDEYHQVQLENWDSLPEEEKISLISKLIINSYDCLPDHVYDYTYKNRNVVRYLMDSLPFYPKNNDDCSRLSEIYLNRIQKLIDLEDPEDDCSGEGDPDEKEETENPNAPDGDDPKDDEEKVEGKDGFDFEQNKIAEKWLTKANDNTPIISEDLNSSVEAVMTIIKSRKKYVEIVTPKSNIPEHKTNYQNVVKKNVRLIASLASVFELRLKECIIRENEKRRGKLSRSRLHAFSYTDRLFYQEEDRSCQGANIMLLADESGSMAGVVSETRKMLAILSESLALAPNVTFSAYSHKVVGGYGNCKLTRLNDPMKLPAKHNVMHYGRNMTSNVDYRAIDAASQLFPQTNQKKLLIILNDGCPCAENGCKDPIEDTAWAVDKIAKERKVETLAVGLRVPEAYLRRIYKENFIMADSMESGISQLTLRLQTMLLERG